MNRSSVVGFVAGLGVAYGIYHWAIKHDKLMRIRFKAHPSEWHAMLRAGVTLRASGEE